MKKLVQAIVLCFVTLSLIDCVAQTNLQSPAQNGADPCSQTSQQTARAVDESYSRQTAYSSGEDSLNRLQDYFQPALKANEKSFQGEQGSVRGFGAGRGYPQIWLRDSATLIPATRYYYTLEYLATWIEEHLAHQGADGNLFDWIAAGPVASFQSQGAPKAREVYRAAPNQAGSDILTIVADKNSTEADQETSAVDAAYQVFRVTGERNWLKRSIKGRTLLERLDRALEYLFKARFDSKYGLVTNAFTADWGDVSPVYNDQRAIYLDEKTPLVVGLYTNVLFYRASLQLHELHMALKETQKAEWWKLKAALIKASINKHLWQEDKGFYRIHLTTTPALIKDWPEESNLFAMGGNGLAVLYGVADDRQARKIFEVAEKRQREFGFSTIAGVLTPSYPKGFFKHPAVNEEYYYQNGAQWDWFAGRFLLAEFERGYSARAFRQLIEIGKKTVTNKGLYEWHTKEGKGIGSSDYAGNAGALAASIFQGLYGVYLSEQGLKLKIRLGAEPGQIHLYQPATDKYVAYQYCYSETTRTVSLSFESNTPGTGEICVLLPKNGRAEKLTLDGKKRSLTQAQTGEDAYGCFATDWKRHRAELKISARN